MIATEIEIDKIEIVSGGHIQVRTARKIIEDGNIIATTFSRVCYSPNLALNEVPEEIRAIAAVVWTEDVINNYLESLENSLISK